MKSYLAILLIILVCFGCEQDNPAPEEPAEVQFGLAIQNNTDNGGRTNTTLTPSKIRVTITDNLGNVVAEDEVIDIVPFGNTFTSSPLRLSPGSYRLTSFLVLNEGDTAIYAAPLENSPLAQLVNDPLPIDFEVVRDEVTNVEVEVIAIDDTDPSEFGYVSFTPVFVPTFKFEVVVFEKDTVNKTFNTTSASLTVLANNDTIRQLDLIAGVNLVEVLDDQISYQLIFAKEGFETIDSTFTRSQLLSHTQGTGNAPLEIFMEFVINSEQAVSFIDSGQRLGVDGARAVKLGDLDGDGDLDAYIVGRGNNSYNFGWRNNGQGTFSAIGNWGLNDDIFDAGLADLDGDGDLDVFNANNGPDEVWKNSGIQGRDFFLDTGQKLGSGASRAVALGDIDGDGDIDAVTNTVWFNNGNASFSNGPNPQTFGNDDVYGVELIDIDNDADLDAITAIVRQNGMSKIWTNDGNGNFTDSGIDFGSDLYTDVEVADFNGDGLLDILFIRHILTPSSLFLNQGNGTFTKQPIADLPRSPNAATGDFNNDGDIDFIASLLSADGRAAIYNNNGAGSFERLGSGQLPGPVTNDEIAVGDLNGDQILDLFIANSGAVGHQIFFGQQ